MVHAEKGSLLRKVLLILLFIVLLTDLIPGLGIGIGSGLSGKNLLLYIIGLLIVSSSVTNARGVQFSDMDIHFPMLLLIVYAMITIVIASAFSPSYSILRGIITLKNQLVDLYFFMFAFRYCIDRRMDFVILLRFVVVTLLILSFITFIDLLNIPDLGLIDTQKGRIEGPFGSANQYGALLAFLLPISIATIRPGMKSWRKMLWWSGILVSAALLLATGSRGAFVSTLIGSVIGVFLLRHHLNMGRVARFAGIAVGVLVILIVIFLFFNADLILERVDKTTSGNIYVASSGRLAIWTAAIQVMLEWPLSFLVGNGWNSFESSGIWKSAHNEYMDRFYELGIIGLALFVWLLIRIVSRVRRQLADVDNEARKILIGFIFSMAIVVVNINFAGIPDTWTIIWIITGLVMGIQATAKTESPSVGRKTRRLPATTDMQLKGKKELEKLYGAVKSEIS